MGRKDADYDCLDCKRILYKLDGNWATRARRVKIKKIPKPGDLYADCIEAVE